MEGLGLHIYGGVLVVFFLFGPLALPVYHIRKENALEIIFFPLLIFCQHIILGAI